MGLGLEEKSILASEVRICDEGFQVLVWVCEFGGVLRFLKVDLRWSVSWSAAIWPCIPDLTESFRILELQLHRHSFLKL